MKSRLSVFATFLLALLALLAPLAPPSPAGAIGELTRGDFTLDATGSARLTSAILAFPDEAKLMGQEDTVLGAGVSRLLLQGDLASRVDYEVNLFTNLSWSPESSMGGSLATVALLRSPYRNRHLSWDFLEEGEGQGQLGLDRLVFNVQLEPLRVSAGRLPVNYSVTHIFTPNDFFAPFAATAVNKIYKPGVDALRLGLAMGQLSALELVGILGSDLDGTPDWQESALLLRANTVLWETEWALLGGKLAERWAVGVSFQGALGPLGLRGEGHVGFPDRDGDGTLDEGHDDYRDVHLRAALGADHKLDWRNAQLALEVLYQSDGAWETRDYLSRLVGLYPDNLPYMGRLYAGLSAGGEILPILRLQLVGLVNTGDGSGIGMLSLVHNHADEADLVAGLLIPWGRRGVSVTDLSVESELGMSPLVFVVEMRVYF